MADEKQVVRKQGPIKFVYFAGKIACGSKMYARAAIAPSPSAMGGETMHATSAVKNPDGLGLDLLRNETVFCTVGAGQIGFISYIDLAKV